MAFTASEARYEERSREISKYIIHPGAKRPGEGTGDSPFEARLQSWLLAPAVMILLFIGIQLQMPRISLPWLQLDAVTIVETKVDAPAAVPTSAPPVVKLVIPQTTEVPSLVAAPKAYTVKAGDTLWGLTGNHWPTVCEQNRIRNCDLILTGQVIQIPESFLQEKERRNE